MLAGPPAPTARLHPWFHPPKRYRSDGYKILPFRFEQLETDRYVATNLAGEYVVLDRAKIDLIVAGQLSASDPIYAELVSRHFIYEAGNEVALDLLATKYRTRLAPLADFTGLHLFVVTLRCDHSCPYCQVSRVSADRAAFDMTPETATRAVDLVFRSPNPAPKIEFQGGEPLLAFERIRQIVLEAEERNRGEQRRLAFVVATNLSQITDEMLTFFREHQVAISTSLDGPKDLHNSIRPRPGGDAYEKTIDGIRRCREALGADSVSALVTTTRKSLQCPEAIVDEYLRQGFRSVFLRWLSPYGFATKSARAVGYPQAEWQRFYERGLRHVLRLNLAGTQIREEYAAIVLRKMLTPFPTGYVDLQSPTGLGLSVAVYNYDGDVYASDEGRMLAEAGDKSFRLGNVHRDSYEAMFLSDQLKDVVSRTMTDATPMCAECAFEPFCGTDPTFHRATQRDPVGHRPTSDFCSRNLFVFRLLLQLLEDDPESAEVLRGWAV